MSELIVFPDIEAAMREYLVPKLAVAVGTGRPTTELPYIQVTRVGGQREGPIGEAAMVTVTVWDTDEVTAANLARMARAYIWMVEQGTMAPDVWVRGVDEVAGPSRRVDPTTDMPHYSFTVQLHLRGTVLE